MPFRSEHFKKHFIKEMGKECSFLDIDEYKNKKTPLQKVRFIRNTMKIMEDTIKPKHLQSIMQKCGMECIGQSLIKKAKTIYNDSTFLKSFLKKLNENHIGGGHLELNGNVIDASYTKCYCGSVSKTKESISLNYCYCSTGWYKKLFEEVLQKEIKVELIQSIINGADCCTFKIFIS